MARPTKAERKAAAKAAAQAEKERQARLRRQRRLWTAIGSVVAVLVVIGGFVVVKATRHPAPPPGTPEPAPAALITKLTSVPATVADTVGRGSVTALPKPINPPQPQTADGKPQVSYLGAEYCPYCAGQRWSMIIALARFGSFTGLGLTHSATDDVFPDTATLSFYGSHYTSKYLAFEPVEQYSNVRQGQGYAPLQKLTPEQEKLFNTFDAPPYVSAQSAGSIPFVLYGGHYLTAGAPFDVGVLAGKTHQQIVDALGDPTSPITQALVGDANVVTATLCRLTGNQPSNVCTMPGVTTAAAALPAAGAASGGGNGGGNG